MKKVFLIILIGIFCITCEKSKDDENHTKYDNVDIVNDIGFTLMPSSDPYEQTKDSFNLDIDHDKITDMIFYVFSYSLGRESTYNSKIKVLNNYEIAIQESFKYDINEYYQDSMIIEVDSLIVEIPKICNNSDTISNQLTYVSTFIDLAYDHYNSFQDYSGEIDIPGWNNIGDKYIGLHNKTDNIYCWVKMNVSEYSKIELKTYSYSIDKDFLVIKE